MIAEIGHYSLYLALMLSLAQIAMPLTGAHRQDLVFMRSGRYLALSQFLFVAIAFLCLLYVFARSDFSVALVAQHSHSTQPLFYKLTAAWGNHEGSLLLWILILAFFGALSALFNKSGDEALKARAIAIQGAIGSAFLLFLLFSSNPFLRLDPPFADGQELNPVLQDPSLAFHPPFLYLGYVGFSMSFSFAFAALLGKPIRDEWTKLARPWMMLSWIALTAGIALGAHWAYYELGWGGYWFWDPVENASFMPWLTGTALLHTSMATQKRGVFRHWSLLLAILTFGFSLLGTFLVRSGILISVHAFAVDPDRGLIILGIIALVVGLALGLFAFRAKDIHDEKGSSPLSRESGLLINTLLLSVAAMIVFLGTLYPLILNILSGQLISVGAPYFALTFVPIILPAIILAGVGTLLPWQKAHLYTLKKIITLPALLGLVSFIGLLIYDHQQILAALAIAAAIGLFASIILQLIARGKSLRLNEAGTHLAHLGLAILTIGIAASSAWKEEALVTLSMGGIGQLNDLSFELVEVKQSAEANYLVERAKIDVRQGEVYLTTLYPERRHYLVQATRTSETDIHSHLGYDLYGALGDSDGKGGWVIRLYFLPMVMWIWVGAALMTSGGILSLLRLTLKKVKANA